jgi:hypothetical protein
MSIAELRRTYHRQLCEQILAAPSGIPNIADKGSKASVAIAQSLVRRLDYPLALKAPPGQRAGMRFEQITSEFLEQAFNLLHHLRPGEWRFAVNQNILPNLPLFARLIALHHV